MKVLEAISIFSFSKYLPIVKVPILRKKKIQENAAWVLHSSFVQSTFQNSLSLGAVSSKNFFSSKEYTAK